MYRSIRHHNGQFISQLLPQPTCQWSLQQFHVT